MFCVCWQPAVPPAAEDTAADNELRDSFKKISGEDMEIDAYELQDILNTAFAKGTQYKVTFFCIICFASFADSRVARLKLHK